MVVGASKIRSAVFAIVMLGACYPLLAWAESIPWKSRFNLSTGRSGSFADIMIFVIPAVAYFLHKTIQQIHNGGLQTGKERSFLPAEIMLLAIALIFNSLIFGWDFTD